ncbi:MAG: hypothetical protein SFU53_14160 [Terrimicrobiaceae bacterium]|nr:hypothetical protein [Terrimicrobiaceae bacterium]
MMIKPRIVSLVLLSVWPVRAETVLDFSQADEVATAFGQTKSLVVQAGEPGVAGKPGRASFSGEIEEIRYRGSRFAWGEGGDRLTVAFKFRLESVNDAVLSIGLLVPGLMMNNSGGTLVLRYVSNPKVTGRIEAILDGRHQRTFVAAYLEPGRVYLMRAIFSIATAGETVDASLELSDCGPDGSGAPRVVAELPGSGFVSAPLAQSPQIEVGLRMGGSGVAWLDDFSILSEGRTP